MAPPFAVARIELDYPLYAIDYDDQDSNRLVVGGGGGAGRSGVGNRITVLETTSQTELRVAGQIDLPRNEDSVMSLALGSHKGNSTSLYAGVNSSAESILKGKNEHLRTLSIEQSRARASTAAKAPDVNVTETNRSAFFVNPDQEAYQRLLRVSGDVGAAATAMGKESQLAVFHTAGATPKLRGVIELAKEAEDLDVIQKDDTEHQVAFCYKYELHLVDIGKESSDPELVFAIPSDEEPRPMFRSIRYLTPGFILAVANLPKRKGIILYGFRLPSPGQPRARLAVTARIPGEISATALAVTNLTPPASPSTTVGDAQFLIAVAGHDSSISLFTLDHVSGASIPLLANFWSLRTLKQVHGADNITGMAFSTFVAPKNNLRPQFIKLASISLQSVVAVQSIPLRKHVDKTPRNPKGPPRTSRYVVAMKSRAPSPRPVLIALGVFTLILAILAQAILETYGGHKPILGAHRFLPSQYGSLRNPEHPPADLMVNDFLAKLSGDKPVEGQTLVVYETEPSTNLGQDGDQDGDQDESETTGKIQLDVHDEAVHGPGMPWDNLSDEQKKAWKDRLHKAGAWTQNMGESVFKGIMFGELAGAVGRAVGGN